MKIGLLGGSFDPPHKGHLAIAETAIEQLELDEVIFMPANRNPLKTGKMIAPAVDRLEMIRLMISSYPGFAVCDLEITRGGPSYMVETLTEIQIVRPGEYWLLMGTDTLQTLPKWKQPEKILKLCRVGVVPRGVYTHEEVSAWLPPEFDAALDFLEMPPMEISSTDIRTKIDQNQPVTNWLCKEVIQYIEKKKLYRS
jgi:nicotinate-nucleotide adenylyltransferase